MTKATATHSDDDDSLPLDQALRFWRQALASAGRSRATITSYLAAGELLLEYLEREELPTGVATIGRRTIQAFMVDLAGRDTRLGAKTSPGTMANRHRSLQQLFRYLYDERDIEVNPMAGMSVPTTPLPLIPIIRDEPMRALLAATEGADFDARRDGAIIRVMLDSGVRADETLSMMAESIDLDRGVIPVWGKGGREREVVVGEASVTALARYLRLRRTHRHATADALWLGSRGPLGYTGLQLLLQRRADLAGIGHIHPHMLRHTWARNVKKSGIQTDEMMALGGWESELMVRRYGRADVAERAVETGRRLSKIDAITRRGGRR